MKTAPAPANGTANGTDYAEVPLDKIRSSKTNPRKRFPEDGLQELAESVRAHGILQPVLLRPIFQGRPGHAEIAEETGTFELVVGERRFRAAKLAGLKTIPARVRRLSDLDVLEIQVVENDQRSDILPSERAAGYQALLADYSVEELAAKVGKSPSCVRGVLLLARMPAPLAEAVDAGDVPRSTAELVCRMPNPELRLQAARCVLHGCANPRYFGEDGRPRPGYLPSREEPLSCRGTRDLIGEHFMKELKGAPFSPKDARLLESAGACTTCPRRTGNDRELYPDGRADVCTDPPCYQQKVAAQAARAEELARARGVEVLDADTCARLFPYGSHVSGGHYLDLADKVGEPVPWNSPLRKKTWKAVLGEHCPQVFLAHDREGRPHYLVKAAAAHKALEASGALKKEKAVNGRARDNGRAPREPGTWAVEERACEMAVDALADMMLANAEGLEALADQGGPETNAAHEALALTARCVAQAELGVCNDEGAVRRIPGLVVDGEVAEDAAAVVRAWAAKAPPAELLGFLLAVAAQEQFRHYRADQALRNDLLAYADVQWDDLLKKAKKDLVGPKPKKAKGEPAGVAAARGGRP